MAAQSRPPRFLLTRPAVQGARFSASLRQRFPSAVVVESPLIAPRYLSPPQPPGPFSAVIFTSETGVEAARRLGPPLAGAAFCVGDRTAEAARAAGYRALSGGGDADDLLAAILAAAPAGRLVHLHGQETRGNLAERLNSAGSETVSLTIYTQDPQPLNAAARALLESGGPVLVPLFSPRTAALFSAAAAGARADLHLAALSPAVAEAVCLTAASLVVVPRPDAAEMLDALAVLAEKAGGA